MARRRWTPQARADAFAEAVNSTGDTGAVPVNSSNPAASPSSKDAHLGALVTRMHALPTALREPPPSPTFTAATRLALVAAATVAAAEAARHTGAAAGHLADTAQPGGLSTATAAGSSPAAAPPAVGAAGSVPAAGGVTGFATATSVTANIVHAALPLLVGAVSIATAVTGVGVAAHRSTPGQPFYAVQKATEQVQLDLTSGATSTAKARLGFVAARLTEIDALSSAAPSALTRTRITALLA